MSKLLDKIRSLSNQLRTSQSIMRERLRIINKQFLSLVILLTLLCLVTLPLAFMPIQKTDLLPTPELIPPSISEDSENLASETETESESEEIALNELEEVHEDLGDEPVEPQAELSLDEVEKRAALGELKVTNRTMQKGDSLLGILAEQNVPATDRMAIVDALQSLLDLKSLRPGLGFIFFHEADNSLAGLTVTPKANETLSVLREKDGSWTTFSQTGRVETKQEHIKVTIERTFSGSAQKAGVPANVVNQIIAAFDGEFDFTSEIKPIKSHTRWAGNWQQTSCIYWLKNKFKRTTQIRLW